jgi:hypothetical protein
MRFFSRHLDIAALSDSLAGLVSGTDETHLAACPRCRSERDRLRAGLAAVVAGATAAADHALPATTLERQRQSIRQRIGRLSAGARLLPFPVAAAARPVEPVRADRRWIAAAAVAGLLVGVGVERLQHGLDGPAGAPGGSAAEATQRAAAEAFTAEPWRDDPLLSDVDAVLTRETRPEFEALDGLTPTSDDGH